MVLLIIHKKEREHGDTVQSQKSGNVLKVMKVFDYSDSKFREGSFVVGGAAVGC